MYYQRQYKIRTSFFCIIACLSAKIRSFFYTKYKMRLSLRKNLPGYCGTWQVSEEAVVVVRVSPNANGMSTHKTNQKATWRPVFF